MESNFSSRPVVFTNRNNVYGTLGDDYEKQLERLIDEHLTQMRFKAADKYRFDRSAQALRHDCEHKLAVYAAHCTQYRRANNLIPFHWSLESVDRVIGALRGHKLPEAKRVVSPK